MATSSTFQDVLDAVDRLPPEDQEALIEIVDRRRASRRRAKLASDVKEARDEFRAGTCVPQTPTDIMRESIGTHNEVY